MQLRCPSCSKSLQVDGQSAGKRVKCPCGTILQVPGTASQASAPKTAAAPLAATQGKPMVTGKPVAAGASRAGAAVRAGGTAPAQAAPKGTAANAFGIDRSEMDSLFGELTEGDMVVKSPSSAPAKAKKTKDPLAAYGHAPPPAKAGKGSSAPSTSASKPASNGRRTVAIVLFVLAALFLASAIKVILYDKDQILGTRTGAFVAGFYVGAFLPTVICAAIGALLIRPKRA